MKKLLYIWCILVIPHVGMTQFSFSPQYLELDTSAYFKAGIHSEAYANSNVLNAQLVNAALFGGYIPPNSRQEMLKKAGSFNNVGSFLNTSLYFLTRIDSFASPQNSQRYLWVKAAHRNENFSTFSTNALQFAFFGNAQFAGETTAIDPIGFNNFGYSQIQIGYIQEWRHGLKFGIAPSLLIGDHNQQAYSDNLEITTSEKGDSILVSGTFDARLTEPNNNLIHYNGVGFSVDIFGSIPFDLIKDSSQLALLNISVTDIGFLNFFGNSTRYKGDTAYTYTGVYIPNVFNPASPVYGDQPENIFDSITTTTKESYIMWLPTTIQANLSQQYGSWTGTLGTTFRNNAYYRPFFYLKGQKQFTQFFSLAAQINQGGYGNFGGGIELQYQKNGLQFTLGSTNMEGFIAPQKTAGTGIYFHISKSW